MFIMVDFKYFQRVLLLLQIGSNFAIPIAVGTYIGSHLDKKYCTNSIFLILGFLVGAFSGVLSTYRLISFELKRKNDKNS